MKHVFEKLFVVGPRIGAQDGIVHVREEVTVYPEVAELAVNEFGENTRGVGNAER